VARAQVSTECKERGELLGLLLEHWTGAVQLREGLAAEARLGAMQVSEGVQGTHGMCEVTGQRCCRCIT
jgi:hypothetical protein